jgi:hypothetical protein
LTSLKAYHATYNAVNWYLARRFEMSASKDDILALLVHLGYLAFDGERSEVFIPNEEIRGEFIRAVKGNGWNEIMDSIKQSVELLEA